MASLLHPTVDPIEERKDGFPATTVRYLILGKHHIADVAAEGIAFSELDILVTARRQSRWSSSISGLS
ncbi:MAG: hypothetical protein M9909_04330 [Thermomicrobiales bacterium]|nr:hypothetical protein [Thermomicrobiales bacterium]